MDQLVKTKGRKLVFDRPCARWVEGKRADPGLPCGLGCQHAVPCRILASEKTELRDEICRIIASADPSYAAQMERKAIAVLAATPSPKPARGGGAARAKGPETGGYGTPGTGAQGGRRREPTGGGRTSAPRASLFQTAEAATPGGGASTNMYADLAKVDEEGEHMSDPDGEAMAMD